MRIFSYRNKRTLRRIALIALLAVVLLGLLILARISYLGRYVVYSPNGVYFDKTQKLQRTPQTPEAPADAEDYPFETILVRRCRGNGRRPERGAAARLLYLHDHAGKQRGRGAAGAGRRGRL